MTQLFLIFFVFEAVVFVFDAVVFVFDAVVFVFDAVVFVFDAVRLPNGDRGVRLPRDRTE